MPPRSDLGRYRRYLAQEFDNAVLYRRLAAEAKGEHREVLLELAAAEERHARFWQDKLTEHGETPATVADHRPRAVTRLLAWLGRRLGVVVIVPLLERVEAAERGRYREEPELSEGIATDELVHAQLVARLAPAWRARASGSLRAGVFGMNDGLVSNLALVMGMAGGNVSGDVVLLAGLAGLVAGAGSMAAGEYISVKSQRELLEGEQVLGREEINAITGAAGTQLELLMRLHGLDQDEAAAIAARGDPAAAAEAMATPVADVTGLGSPSGAAASSFVAFATGAALPVLPFLFTSGGAALGAAAVLAGTALFLLGSVISLLTHRPLLRAGGRQLAVGALAAAGTYLVGRTVDLAIG